MRTVPARPLPGPAPAPGGGFDLLLHVVDVRGPALEWSVGDEAGEPCVGGRQPAAERVPVAAVLPPPWAGGRLLLRDGAGELAVPLAPYEQRGRFRLPLDGDVLVAVGHRLGEVHRSAWELPSQRFGWDLVPLAADGLGLLLGPVAPGLAPADFAGFGRPVLAPARGTIVRAVDDADDAPAIGVLPDREAFLADPLLAAGNHVVVEHAHGAWSLLAHLRRGSVRVAAGDAVEEGDALGEVGSSGFSSGPHLHLHLMDGPDPLTASPLPVALALEDGERDPQAGEIVAPP